MLLHQTVDIFLECDLMQFLLSGKFITRRAYSTVELFQAPHVQRTWRHRVLARRGTRALPAYSRDTMTIL